MGKAKRLHRDRVRLGLEKPYNRPPMTDEQWDKYKQEHHLPPYTNTEPLPQPEATDPLLAVSQMLKRMGLS